MPSLCTKISENQGGDRAVAPSPPPESSLNQALAIVEKKVRNLEKRKAKLDTYRESKAAGKALNEDQKLAVSKYDEVLGSLDLVRDMSQLITKLVQDEARDKKKMLKKEQQEKAKAELNKVSYFLRVQHLLNLLQEPGSDQVIGELAPQVSKAALSDLTGFGLLVSPGREDVEPAKFEAAVALAAEHFLNLYEQKAKTVNGTSYKDLNSTINSILDSGFLHSVPEKSNNAKEDVESRSEDEDGDDEDTEEEPEKQTNGHKDESEMNRMLGQPASLLTQEPVPEHTPVVEERPAPSSPAPALDQNRPEVQPPAPEPSFNFLQESQIDLESPMMDPAVVMVQGARKPDQVYPAPMFQPLPPTSLTNGIQHQHQLMQQHAAALAHHHHQQQQQLGHPQLQQLEQLHQQQLAGRGPGFQPTNLQQVEQQIFKEQESLNKQETFNQDYEQQNIYEKKRGTHPPFSQEHTQDQSTLDATRPDPQPTQEETKPRVSGYAAAAAGPTYRPDPEIGTWKPEGAQDSGEEGRREDRGPRGSRGGGGGGSRGFGRGGRGYSRGRGGGGDRGGYRGGRGGGGERNDRGGDRNDRGGDRNDRGGDRNDRGGDRTDRGGERGEYRGDRGDRNDRPRSDRPRGSGPRGGGGGGRGSGGPRGGGPRGPPREQ